MAGSVETAAKEPTKRKLRVSLKNQRQSLVQEEVLNAATTLFARSGYRAVSMDQIASEIGFGKSSIYYYFDTKGELLLRIYQFIIANYLERAQEIAKTFPSPAERLRQLTLNHITVLLNHKDWTTVFFRDLSELADEHRAEILQSMREYNSIFEDVYNEGVASGIFRDQPVKVAVNGILGACNWLTHWFKDESKSGAEQVAQQLTAMLAEGYQARTSPQAD